MKGIVVLELVGALVSTFVLANIEVKPSVSVDGLVNKTSALVNETVSEKIKSIRASNSIQKSTYISGFSANSQNLVS